MLVSRGNRKLGTDTLILNITSAADCMSRKLGLCALGTKCYALKAERMYKAVLPYRRKQTEYWDQSHPATIAMDLWKEIFRSTKQPIKYIRISEAGDFRNQADVDKLIKIAEILGAIDVTLYGYTARRDLAFGKCPCNLIMNGSGFMIHNSFTAVSKTSLAQHPVTCTGNCRGCNLCKIRGKLAIKVGIH